MTAIWVVFMVFVVTSTALDCPTSYVTAPQVPNPALPVNFQRLINATFPAYPGALNVSCVRVVVSSGGGGFVVGGNVDTHFAQGDDHVAFYEGDRSISGVEGVFIGRIFHDDSNESGNFMTRTDTLSIEVYTDPIDTGYYVHIYVQAYLGSFTYCNQSTPTNISIPLNGQILLQEPAQLGQYACYSPVGGICEWNIRTTASGAIAGTIYANWLSRGDAVTIYENGVLIAAGSNLVPSVNYLSRGAWITVRLETASGSKIGHRGFSLAANAVPAVSMCQGTGLVSAASSGSISVPLNLQPSLIGFPGASYAANTTCTFLLQSPPGTIIQGTMAYFNLFFSDTFSAWDGNTTSSPLLFSYGGLSQPRLNVTLIASLSNAILLRFSSANVSRLGNGLIFNYTVIPAPTFCSGLQNIVSDSGFVSAWSPYQAIPRTLVPNLNCSWSITVSGGKGVKLLTNSTNFPVGAVLQVFELNADGSTTLRLSANGSSSLPYGTVVESYTVASNRMLVTFTTPPVVQGRYALFSLNMTSFILVPPCVNGTFRSSSGSLNYPTNGIPASIPLGATCKWLVMTQTIGTLATVDLNFASLRPGLDHITFYDGNFTTNRILAHYSGPVGTQGWARETNIIASGPSILVVLNTSGMDAGPGNCLGFSANWGEAPSYAGVPNQFCQPNNTIVNTGTNAITCAGGLITPGCSTFTPGGSYQRRAFCRWNFPYNTSANRFARVQWWAPASASIKMWAGAQLVASCPPLLPLAPDAPYTPCLTPAVHSSYANNTGNMTIEFSSGDRLDPNDRFYFTPFVSALGLGGGPCMQNFAAESGMAMLHGSTFNGWHYTIGQTCLQTINTTIGKLLVLTPNRIDILEGARLYVYDGATTSAPLLANYSYPNQAHNTVLTASSHFVTILFIGPPNPDAPLGYGYCFSYASLDPVWQCNGTVTYYRPAKTTNGPYTYDHEPSTASPLYAYPPNLICDMVFTTDPGASVFMILYYTLQEGIDWVAVIDDGVTIFNATGLYGCSGYIPATPRPLRVRLQTGSIPADPRSQNWGVGVNWGTTAVPVSPPSYTLRSNYQDVLTYPLDYFSTQPISGYGPNQTFDYSIFAPDGWIASAGVTGIIQSTDSILVLDEGRSIALLTGTMKAQFVSSQCGSLVLRFTSSLDATIAGQRQGFQITPYLNFMSDGVNDACRTKLNMTLGVCASYDVSMNDPNDVARYDHCRLTGDDTGNPICYEHQPIDQPTASRPERIIYAVSSDTIFTNLTFPNLVVLGSMTTSFTQRLFFPELKHIVVQFQANGAQFAAIYVPELVTANSITVTFSYSLEELIFPKLQVMNALSLSDDTALQRLHYPLLRWCHTFISFINIADVDFSSCGLEAPPFTTDLFQGTTVTTLSWPSMRSSTSLYLVDNTNMRSVDLPVFTTGSVDLTNSGQLTSLNMPLFESGRLTVTRSLLTALSLPSLREASIQMDDNRFLMALQAPKWTHIIALCLSKAPAMVTLDIRSAKQIDSLTLTKNNGLEAVFFCNVSYLGAFSLTSNALLSCYDFGAMFSSNGLNNSFDGLAFPACNPSTRGVFTCQENVNQTVDVHGCGFTTACIQAGIDAMYSEHGNQLLLPAGTYTGCSQPLNTRGKSFVMIGLSRTPGGVTIDCQGAGQGLIINQGESGSTEIHNISFVNGVAEVGGNLAVDGASPSFFDCIFSGGQASVSGGGVALLNGAAPVFHRCQFVENGAPIGGGVHVSGGASLHLMGGVIANNHADAEGGGVYLTNAAMTILDHVILSGNSAARGSGLYTDSAALLNGCTIRFNIAAQYGGGLALIPSQATGVWTNISGATLSGNTARTGAGLFGFSSNVAANNVSFTNNVAATEGGGLSATCNQNYRVFYNVKGPCTVYLAIHSCLFQNNTATGANGAAMTLRDVFVDLQDTLIASNRGASATVYASITALVARRVTWQNNVVSGNGGGLSCEPLTGVCDVALSVFDSNSASAGGAIYLCIAGCPNNTRGSTGPSLASLIMGNVYTDNAAAAYGVDAATDPATLRWNLPTSLAAVSGRAISDSISVQVTDGFGATVTSSTTFLTVSLTAQLAGGSAAGDAVVIGGSQTALANRGFASIGIITLSPKNVSYLDKTVMLSCQLTQVASVRVSTQVTLLSCGLGQGRTDVASAITCGDCAPGSYSTGAPDYLCVLCPAGSYAPGVSSLCLPCPANSKSPSPGQGSCVPCASGETAAEGSTECTAAAATVGLEGASLTGTIVGVILFLLIAAVVIAYFIYRTARRRTLHKYYLDNDATVRAGVQETTLQKAIKKILLATSTTRIGGGLYSNVYKAKYEGRWIALKVIKGEMATDGTAQQEFRREAVALSRMEERNHPGIVGLQFFVSFNPMCIGVAFCSGGSLKNALSQRLFPDINERIRLVAEAASAMCVVHACNIVHLDLKTDNMLLTDDHHLVIADFGIARTMDTGEMEVTGEFVATTSSQRSSTHASGHVSHVSTVASHVNGAAAVPMGSGVGVAGGSSGSLNGSIVKVKTSKEAFDTAFTPQYVDPLRLLNDWNDDHDYLRRADVFSFGMMMWAIFAQEEPYAGQRPETLIESLQSMPSMRPRPLEGVPAFYDTLMHRCWHAVPAERPSFQDVFSTLAKHMQEQGISLDARYADASKWQARYAQNDLVASLSSTNPAFDETDGGAAVELMTIPTAFHTASFVPPPPIETQSMYERQLDSLPPPALPPRP